MNTIAYKRCRFILIAVYKEGDLLFSDLIIRTQDIINYYNI